MLILFRNRKIIVMDYNKLITAEENTVLAHVVFKEHTLGYLFRIGNSLHLGILSASVLKGSPWNSLLTGNVQIFSDQFEYVREATQKDFDSFNESSNGHLKPYKKTNALLW